MKRFYDFCQRSDMMTDNVDVRHLEHFIRYDGTGRLHSDGSLSLSYQNQRLAVLRQFFDWCVSRNYARENPLKGRDIRFRRKERLQRPAVLTGTQVERLLQLSRKSKYGRRNLVLISLFVGTGGRLKEVVALTEQDVDLEHRRVMYHGKGDKYRVVPLEPELAQLLADYMADLPRLRDKLNVQPKHRQYLFYSYEGRQRGCPIGRRAVQDMVGRLLQQMNLPRTPDYARLSVHKLRHTYAIGQLMRGRSIYQLKDLLGHSSVETTMVYLAALSDEFLQQQLETQYPITEALREQIRQARRGGLRVIEGLDSR